MARVFNTDIGASFDQLRRDPLMAVLDSHQNRHVAIPRLHIEIRSRFDQQLCRPFAPLEYGDMQGRPTVGIARIETDTSGNELPNSRRIAFIGGIM